jgi:hypothetical protein
MFGHLGEIKIRRFIVNINRGSKGKHPFTREKGVQTMLSGCGAFLPDFITIQAIEAGIPEY